MWDVGRDRRSTCDLGCPVPVGDPPSRVGPFSNELFLPDRPRKIIKQVEDVAVDCISAD